MLSVLAHSYFIPPKLACRTNNIPSIPTSKLDDTSTRVSLRDIQGRAYADPQPVFNLFVLAFRINSFSIGNLLFHRLFSISRVGSLDLSSSVTTV